MDNIGYDLIQLILAVIQTVMILVASIVGVIQLNKNTRSNKSQAYSRIGERLQRVNEILFKHPEFYQLMNLDEKKITQIEKGNNSKVIKFKIFLDMVFSYFREIYYQKNEYKLIQSSQWKAWEGLMIKTLRRPYPRKYFILRSDEYPTDYKNYILSIANYSNEEVDAILNSSTVKDLLGDEELLTTKESGTRPNNG